MKRIELQEIQIYYIKGKDEFGAPNVKKFTNPAQHLIVTLLFSAYNQEQKVENYEDGLVKLERVIRCFQKQNVFEVIADSAPVKLILDMESLKISELNQLWSMLGNKYMPSVCYKMRLITIQNDTKTDEDVIEKVKLKLWESANSEGLAGQIEETKYFTKEIEDITL